MKKHLVVISITLFAVVLCFGAQDKKTSGQSATKTDHSHVVIAADKIKWVDAPNLGAGIQIAELEGDPSKAGATYSLRVKMPDGFRFPPHWHPVDENLVVLQGTFVLGMGEKFDQSAGQELAVGTYARMPKEMRHFGWAKGETILQVYGIGPFQINYVNPADDPGKKVSSK